MSKTTQAMATILLLLLVACSGVAQSASHGTQGVEAEFAAAMAAADRGDTAHAEAMLTALHRKYPAQSSVTEALGMMMAAHGRASDALPLLHAAVVQMPRSDVAHANYGAALYNLHRKREAAVEFKRAVELNAANGAAWQSLGRIHAEDNLHAQAADDLLHAAALEGGNADLQLDCAQELMLAGDRPKARAMINALGNVNGVARAQSLLGQIDEKDGSYREAAKHLARAAELEPSEENAWQLSLEFLRHWTFIAAGEELDAALKLYPQSLRLRIGLGIASFGSSNYARASQIFAALLHDDPSNSFYASTLGMSCGTESGALPASCELLQKYIDAHPDDQATSIHYAHFLLGKQEDEAALKRGEALLRTVIAQNPSSAEAQFELGKLLEDRGAWAESIPPLQKAMSIRPSYAAAHYRLAIAYAHTGRKQDAAEEIELQKSAARQEKDEAEAFYKKIEVFLVDLHE